MGSINVTPLQISEIKKCMESVTYFAKNYVHIVHPVKGDLLFDLFDYQEEMIDLYSNNRLSIVLSSRQLGKTETASVYLLHEAIFKKNQGIMVTSNQQDGAIEILDRIRYMYESLPDWLVPTAPTYNKTSMYFDNGSKIFARATTAKTGRGKSISLLYCDELSHVQKNIAEDFWTAIYPVISTGGKMIVTSTPNGDNNRFYYIWRDAILLKNQSSDVIFAGLEVHWSRHPERDQSWAKQTKAALGDDSKWMQEYENSFLSNARSVIDLDSLEGLKKFCSSKINRINPLTHDDWTLYRRVVKEVEYYMMVDVSEGIGSDYHVINIFSDKLEQVAMFRTNSIDYEELAKQIKFSSDYYNDALIFIESFPGPGIAVIPYLTKVHQIGDRLMREKPGKPPGLRMTAARRNRGIVNLRNFIPNGRIKINNIEALNELRVFKKKKSGAKFEAEFGCHDDIVMTLVMLCSESDRLISMNDNIYDALYVTDETIEGHVSEEAEELQTAAPAAPVMHTNIIGNKKMISEEDRWLYG